MKRIFITLVIAVVSLQLFSCQQHEGFEAPMNEEILLDISSVNTRAEHTQTESYVSHLDIFIFEQSAGVAATKCYYERYQVNNESTITLNARRSSFAVGANYYVYLIANSNLSTEQFATVGSHSDLIDMKQQDELVHLTGLNISGAPKYFLMDALAENGPVVLNNGNVADNTILRATLRRAAAKVVMNVKAGTNISFESFGIEEGSEGGLYYVRNLPYDAFLLSEAKSDNEIEALTRNTAKGNNEYFDWNPETDAENVSLTIYVYPNHWSNTSILEHETCVVVNLPLTYTDGNGEEHSFPNSWYKIPMTGDGYFKRNNYYEVNINLNRPGAITETTPIEINDVYYQVEDWTAQDINVGGEDKPSYLMVNRIELDMHNVNIDESTLEFASSSPVTISVKTVEVNGVTIPDVYYFDKFDRKTYVTPTIVGQTNGGIQGNITVNSPVPDNKTIRYFTLVVTNQEGITKEISVRQYPLVYVVNTLSSYSYRSDMLGDAANEQSWAKHYEDRSQYSRFAVSYSDGVQSLNRGGSKSSGFFVSKYVSETYSSGDNKGLSNVRYYTGTSTGSFNNPYNARMYHIRIMSTSNEYIIGKPKITNGITDSGSDNAKIVSPSFMIASRLGTLTTSLISFDESTAPSPSDYGARYSYGRWTWPTGSDRDGYEAATTKWTNDNYLKVYAEHCKQYVEVYDPDGDSNTDNSVHLRDWRLPTEAELKIIYDFQGNKGADADAIDYLLNAGAYFSASGPVTNPKNDMDGTSVRCIRDAF